MSGPAEDKAGTSGELAHQSQRGVGRWRPQCMDCHRFVPFADYDVMYDWEAGMHEEGYTLCSPGTGCRKDEEARRAA